MAMLQGKLYIKLCKQSWVFSVINGYDIHTVLTMLVS